MYSYSFTSEVTKCFKHLPLNHADELNNPLCSLIAFIFVWDFPKCLSSMSPIESKRDLCF